jgi:hypothetical protein
VSDTTGDATTAGRAPKLVKKSYVQYAFPPRKTPRCFHTGGIPRACTDTAKQHRENDDAVCTQTMPSADGVRPSIVFAHQERDDGVMPYLAAALF